MLTIFNTSPEVARSDVDTAVLPLGSIEPKGPHLPVGLDMMLANRFGRDFSTGKAVYLLPVLPFSTAVEARGFPGAVALRQQTQWDALFDVAGVLGRHGFRRLIVLDFSNYNWIVKHAVREINLNRELLDAIWMNPKEFAREAAEEEMLPDYGGGAVETSLAMALDEAPVDDLPEDFLPESPREYIDYHGLAAVAPDGYWGRPSAASGEEGRRLYGVMLERSLEFAEYALGLFPEGGGLRSDEREELWWPRGEIPGAEGRAPDWHRSISQIRDADAPFAIIPTSATEQHSTSQPLATDYVQALELVRRVASQTGAYLLPAMPVVTSWGHIRFRGTVTFSAMTVRRTIEDVAESLRASGFERAALLNIHGGNWVLKPTLIEINRRYDDFLLVADGDILSYRGQANVELLHASEGEGSFIKAFYPEAFKEENLVDYSPNCPASAFDFTGIGGVTPQGVWGYPSKSTPEQGRREVEEKVERTLDYLDRAFSAADRLRGRGG